MTAEPLIKNNIGITDSRSVISGKKPPSDAEMWGDYIDAELFNIDDLGDFYSDSTFVDNDGHQTIVGTPFDIVGYLDKVFIPIVFGVGNGTIADIKAFETENPFIVGDNGVMVGVNINIDGEDPIWCCGLAYDEDKGIISTMLEVDASNSTALEDIVSITITYDDEPVEGLTEITPIEGDTFGDITFTPGE